MFTKQKAPGTGKGKIQKNGKAVSRPFVGYGRLKRWPKQTILAIFILLFGALGLYLLRLSHAESATTTFTGRLTAKAGSQQYRYTPAGTGTVDASLTFSGSTSLSLSLLDGSGQSIAGAAGPSPVRLSATVSTGASYTFTVSSPIKVGSKGLSFTLTVKNSYTGASCALTGTQTGSDLVVTNCQAGEIVPGSPRGRLAQRGNVTAFYYRGRYNYAPWVYFRDTSTGTYSHVPLPVSDYLSDTLLAWSSPSDLFTISSNGTGPIVLRHFGLSGSPLPITATLLGSQTFGDSDSRVGDILALTSGGVVASWRLQGASNTNAYYLSYWNGTSWGTPAQLGPEFMPSASAKESLVQHPADGSVWLFGNADSWSGVGAVHATETNGALKIDWYDGFYISLDKYGKFTADGENPDIQAVPDPANAAIVLTYESDYRQWFGNPSGVYGVDTNVGSYPVVARIKADKSLSFTQLPVWVERISPMGITAGSNGDVRVLYHPLDTVNITSTTIAYSLLAGGSWQPSTKLADVAKFAVIYYSPTLPQYYLQTTDGLIHLYSR